MTSIVPPTPNSVENFSLQSWHHIFKTDWRDLISIGYVEGAAHRHWTQCITGLVAADGECSFFGEGFLEPEIQPATPSSNETFYAVSSSASDTAILRCWMMDALNEETVVDVTLNGTTPVSIGSYIHSNQAQYRNGYTQNVGNLTVSTKSDAGTPLVITDKVQLHVGIGRGHGNNPTQRCPHNHVFVFTGQDLTSDKADGIHVLMYEMVDVEGSTNRMLVNQWLVYQSALAQDFAIPYAIEEGEEMAITIERSTSATGAANAEVNWNFYVLDAQDPGDSANSSGIEKLFTGT